MALTTNQAIADQVSLAYFGRPQDTGALAIFGAGLVNGSPTADQLAAQFATAESKVVFGASATMSSVIAKSFELVGRVATAQNITDIATWATSAKLAISQMPWEIMKIALATESLLPQASQVAWARLAVAYQFSEDVSANATALQNLATSTTSQDAARAVITGVTSFATIATAYPATGSGTVANFITGTSVVAGQTFTLTTGIDSFTGTSGNDTFTGIVSTFSSLDNIDGGAGTDTINILFAGDLTAAVGATVKNVEVVNLTAGAAITAADLTTGFTGVSTLNVTSTGAIAGVKAAATTDINVANGLGAVTTAGGKNTVIKAAGAVIVTAAAGDVTSTTTTATSTTAITGAGVLIANSNDGTIGFTNGTSVTANATKAVALADVTAHTAARTALIVVAAADASAGTAKVADTAAATIVTNLGTMTTAVAAAATIAANNAATLTALTTAVPTITVAQKQAIDTAYATAFNAVGGTAAKAQAAALAVETPIVTTATAAKAATLVTLTAAAAASTAATVITTADTTAAGLVDGVVVTATTNTALISATINGNYGAALSSVTDASTGNNTLTTLTLNNAGTTTGTGLALTNVSATGMIADVSVVNTTVGHTQNYTLSGVTAGTYLDVNATTVNITSNGTATNVLTALSSTLATKVNLTGTAGLNFGATTLAAAVVIDASANSGSNTITTLATHTYTGGSGVDTVTSSNGVAQSKAIDGGAGVADKLILGNATDFGTTAAAALFKNFEVLQTSVAVDVSKFTASSIGKVIMSGTTAVTGLTAAQAANMVINATSTPTITVTGAATPGQLDTVNIDVNDGATAVATIALTAPVLAGVETLNMTATDNFTIDVLTSSTALTRVTVSGAGTSSITTGALALNTNTVIDASAATGAVVVDAALATANGLQIIGSATKANTLTGNLLGSVLTGGAGNDSITGGAGGDTISGGEGNNTLAGAAGANTITAGNGQNTITVTGSSSANSITVGNGYNTITGGSGIDTIIVGTGGNVITGAAGADLITLGAHAVGVQDIIVYTTNTLAAAAIGANMDTITGFVSGADTIQLQISVFTDATSTNGLKDAAAVVVGQVRVASVGTLLATVTDATSVATMTAVYTALASATGLNNSAGHEFAASTAAAGGIVVREVTYTTGAAAGTYLVINDGTAGFDAATDVVIKLVGNTTVVAGDFSYLVVA